MTLKKCVVISRCYLYLVTIFSRSHSFVCVFFSCLMSSTSQFGSIFEGILSGLF